MSAKQCSNMTQPNAACLCAGCNVGLIVGSNVGCKAWSGTAVGLLFHGTEAIHCPPKLLQIAQPFWERSSLCLPLSVSGARTHAHTQTQSLLAGEHGTQLLVQSLPHPALQRSVGCLGARLRARRAHAGEGGRGGGMSGPIQDHQGLTLNKL